MCAICFEAKLFSIDTTTLLLLPKSVSAKLPSRGMVVVEGTLNGFPFQSALEPDGRGSHWLRCTSAMIAATHTHDGDTVTLMIAPSQACPEPTVPKDLHDALSVDPKVFTLWKSVKPMARWDWIRWISATKNPETRKKRIMVELSKLKNGEKRPCCFNRSMCCDTSVSKNGMLREPNGTYFTK